jgi:multiple sugar transport system permease protein
MISVPARARPRRTVDRLVRSWRGPGQGYWGFVFVLPILLLFIIFKFQPIARASYLSLTDANPFDPEHAFVGLQNYAQLLGDSRFINSVAVTIYYVVGSVIPVVVVSLALALMLNEAIKGIRIYRVLTFLPAIIPIIVVPILWEFLYHRYGLVNTGLEAIGLQGISWLFNKAAVIPAFILATDWRIIPLFAIIYLAGLQSISEDLYDASKVDGASMVQRFRWITLPLLRPTMLVVIVIATLFCARSFVIAFVLTGGGPDNASQTLSIFIYQAGFQFFQVGYASAASMLLLVGMVTVTLVFLRIFRSDDLS